VPLCECRIKIRPRTPGEIWPKTAIKVAPIGEMERERGSATDWIWLAVACNFKTPSLRAASPLAHRSKPGLTVKVI